MKIRISKKYYAVYAAAFSAVLAAAVFVFFSISGKTGEPHGDDNISVWTFFFDETQKAVIDKEFENFTGRYENWSVEHQAFPYREIRQLISAPGSGNTEKIPDIFTVINPAEYDKTFFHNPPVPWSGNFWVFYYNRQHLISLLGHDIKAPSTYSELTALFETVSEKGIIPLSFGASHGWPLTALVQHLAGSLGSKESSGSLAVRLAGGTISPDDPELAPVYNELRRWSSLGWITPDALKLPWTAGVTDILTGKAAFTLLNRQFFDAVPPGMREAVGFFPYPADWAIGSIIYLARPSARPSRPAVREFEKFLLSPGVSDRLEAQLGVPFFGGIQDASLPAVIIPGVTANPAGSYHRRLWYAARDALR